jgi:nitroreductase
MGPSLPAGTPDAAAVMELLSRRRSVRDYTPENVTDEEIATLIQAAQCAPSATNRQPWRFFVVRNRPLIDRMRDAVRDRVAVVKEAIRADFKDEFVQYSEFFTGFTRAPVVIAGLYRSAQGALGLIGKTGPEADRDWLSDRLALDALVGVAAALQNITTMATGLGLATCWMTGPLIAEGEFLRILEVPAGWRIAAVMAVGHPVQTPDRPNRRPLDKIYRIFE